MQATLKRFTTLPNYSLIENPEMSHHFYEMTRAWKSTDRIGEKLKENSDKTLQDINDIICEWINNEDIKKKASLYESFFDILCWIPPTQDERINKLSKFVHEELSTWKPKTEKGLAIYQILLKYYKEDILGR